jgi:hypothetical protein
MEKSFEELKMIEEHILGVGWQIERKLEADMNGTRTLKFEDRTVFKIGCESII